MRYFSNESIYPSEKAENFKFRLQPISIPGFLPLPGVQPLHIIPNPTEFLKPTDNKSGCFHKRQQDVVNRRKFHVRFQL
jgi:hypothetical protein